MALPFGGWPPWMGPNGPQSQTQSLTKKNYKQLVARQQVTTNQTNKTMNTTTAIIAAAIVVAVIIMLISMVITDHISNNKRELEHARRIEKERYYNSLLPKTITFSDMRGYIRAEYAFGRFYVHYECINEECKHYSRTISFHNDGSLRENYSRLGCEYGFENTMHQEAFKQMKERVREIIKYNVTC
jgi:hypothetical protein